MTSSLQDTFKKAAPERMSDRVNRTITKLDDILRSLEGALCTANNLTTNPTPTTDSELLLRLDNIPKDIKYVITVVETIKKELEGTQAVWYRSNGQKVRISAMDNEHLMNAFHRLAYIRAIAQKEVSRIRSESSGTVSTEYRALLQKMRGEYGLSPLTEHAILHGNLVETFPVARNIRAELQKRELPVLINIYE